jgi:hypothetical protein
VCYKILSKDVSQGAEQDSAKDVLQDSTKGVLQGAEQDSAKDVSQGASQGTEIVIV